MKLNKFLAVILTLFACIAPARADWYQFAGGGGGGGGSGTVGSGNAGQVAYYQSTGTTVIGNSNMNVSAGALSLGISTSSAGSVVLFGGTSGSVTISTAAVAGTGTVFQLPATNGSNGQVLQTNGSGVTSWVNAGTGSGTVNSGTAGQMTYYAGTGTAVSGNANANISSGALTLGQSTSVAGSLVLEGATSGAVTVNVPATAGSTTFQLPGTNGSSGQFLQTNGSGVTSWQSGFTNPMTTPGDMILGGTSGTATRLALSNNQYVLQGNGTTAQWAPGGAIANSFVTPTYLNNFRAALAGVTNGTGSCEIYCLGDSLTRRGSNTTTATNTNSWPAILRQQLGSVLPCTEGVITPYGSTLAPPNSVTPDPRFTLGSGWSYSITAIGAGGPNGFSEGGNTTASVGAGGTLSLAPGFVFDTLQVFYYKKSGGATFAPNVDGGSALGSINTSNGSTAAASSTFTVPRGIHTINVPPPTGSGSVNIAGFECTDSAVPSIHVTNGGVGDLSTAVLLNGSTNDGGMSTSIYQPNLTIVMLGAVDAANSVASATYDSNMSSIISLYQRSGASDVVTMTCPNSFQPSTLATNYTAYLPFIYARAASTPTGIIDLWTRFVSYTVSNAAGFDYVDGIHQTQLGYTDDATGVNLALFGGPGSYSTVPTPLAHGGTNANLVASNGAIVQSTTTQLALDPSATLSTGTLTLGQSTSVAGSVILEGGTSGAVTVNVPATAGSTTFQLPGTNGSSGQFLQTNGSGVTSWQTVSGSGTVNSGTGGQGTYYATTGTAVSGNPNENWSTGTVTIGQASSVAGAVVLEGGTSGAVTVGVPATAGSTTFTLPGTNGSSGQFLQTNGSGVTSWQTASGSGTVNAGTANQVAWYATSSTAVSGNANMTIATGALTLGQSGTAGSVTLNGATSGTCLVSVSATAGSTTFQLPSTNGSSGQFLQTNGSGVTSWQTASGSGTVNSGTAGQMTYYATTGTAVSGNANATIINGSMTLGQSATAGALVLNGSSSGTVTISTAAAAGTGTVFQLPATNGTNQYLLQTNGSGVTSWANVLPASATATTQTAGDNTTSVATDAFVTTAISNAIAGVNPAVAVTAATTGVLPNSPTYSNGASGIGATLTAGSNTTLTVDGVTFSALTQSVLVKNQASAFQDGIYNVTQVGSGILPWILTRRIDYDQPSDINNTGAIPVISGTANTDTSWILTSTVNTVGTDALTYTQFTLNPTTIATTPGGTANQIAYFSSTGNQISGNANVTVSTGALTLGQSATAVSVILNGATSGTVTVNVPATAGSTTFTLPGTNGVANQYLQSNGSGVTTWNYVTDIGGNGADGAITKTTQTETSPIDTNATTWTNTNANTYTVLSGSQIKATSTITVPGTITINPATLGGTSSGATIIGLGQGPASSTFATAVAAAASGAAFGGAGGLGNAGARSAPRAIALAYGGYGSGGGSGFGATGLTGGSGGGYVRMCAGTTLTLNATGTISAVGGASSASATNTVAGAGGGSGGGAYLYAGTSITLTSGGVVTVAGGNAGAMTGTSAAGGGGGGGGYVFEESPSNTGAGTITLTGGTATGSTNNGTAGSTGVAYTVADTPTQPLITEHKRQWDEMVASGWLASNHKIGHEAPMFAIARANALCFGDGSHWSTKGHGHAQLLASWRAKDYCEFERLCCEFEEGEDLEGHGKTCLLFIGDVVEVPAA